MEIDFMGRTTGGAPDKGAPRSAIAIVGMAFRLPGDMSDEDSFWEALSSKRDLIGRIPPERWAVRELQHDRRSEPGRSITFSAGVLSDIEKFDAEFFGISPREAAWMDPQQRLLLELSYESMENAGIPPSSLRGTNCAVYVGISSLDYAVYCTEDLASVSSHLMTGITLSTAANRLSYIFDLHGPSLALDTACSSSMVALHHACSSIRSGEVPMALVGGVHILLHPYPFVGFTKASMLSADGRCKPFDASANGYVRSEGGAAFLLKPMQKALEDGDDIQAVILASGTNADGSRKTGITIPSMAGQSELMREVLSKSGLQAKDVDFFETHGTGTSVGDPVEAAAIGQVYGQTHGRPLPISSVKANIGHLEPASGMAGLVKTVLSLKKRAIPPMLHLDSPNPHIDFAGLNLELVSEYKGLDTDKDKALVAGINSFGFGGANAHVLLQQWRPPEKTDPGATTDADVDAPPPPLFLSARNTAALEALAGRYASFLEGKSRQEYYDIAHAAAFRRERLDKRLALCAGDAGEAAALLGRYASGDLPKKLFIEDRPDEGGGLAFVYSGNGAQWLGMGRRLLDQSSGFAGVLAAIDEKMRPLTGFSLLEELRADEETSQLEDTVVAQPLICAIQIGLTILLREQGIRPDAVAGHSVGEVAAAWAAGALDLDQALRVICARSQAQSVARGSGKMAAVGLSPQMVGALLEELGLESDIEIAGVNSPKDVTLSGSFEGLAAVQREVEGRGLFFRFLAIDYAFHSRHMDLIRPKLDASLAGLEPSPCGRARFISAVTGDEMPGENLDAEYWWHNVRYPVRFSDAIAKLAERGCRVFIEIGPNAILQHYIRESLAAANVRGRTLASLRKTGDGVERIAETAARAHMLLEKPDLGTYFPHPARRVRLPNYPWQRETHWYPETVEGHRLTKRRRAHPLLGWPLPDLEGVWENTLDPVVFPWLADHKVGGSVVFPGAGYVEMALAAGRESFGGERLTVEELDIVAPIVFDEEHGRSLRFVLNSRDGSFQIKSRQRLCPDPWTLHAAGRLREAVKTAPPASRFEPLASGEGRVVLAEEHYARASALGLDYGRAFQGLEGARVAGNRLEGILWQPDFADMRDFLLHPALMDVCYQSLVDFVPDDATKGDRTAFLPVRTGRLDLFSTAAPVRFHVHVRRRGLRSILADFELLDKEGGLVASVRDCRFRAARLTLPGRTGVASWHTLPLLRPHPQESPVRIPWSVEELGKLVLAGFAGSGPERSAWFRRTLPLFEALTLSFAYETALELSREYGEDWADRIVTPHGKWLLRLLRREDLLSENGERRPLPAGEDLPPSGELWRMLLAQSPACLPQLTLAGRTGRHLRALVTGEMDGEELLRDLGRSPVVETLYSNDPAYTGTRLAAEALLRHLGRAWPSSRRLRVLEVASGPSSLPGVLGGILPEDRFEYVLALPDQELCSRQQGAYHGQANVRVVKYEPGGWKFELEEQWKDCFDLVILRHSLHCSGRPGAALGEIGPWLRPGGLLFLAERYPDWSADFVEGLAPSWWNEVREGPAGLTRPCSSLVSPEAWRQALAEKGFADVEVFTEPAAESLAEGAYVLLARRPESALPVLLPEPRVSSWLLLADGASFAYARELASHLESLGQDVTVGDVSGEPARGDAGQVVFLAGWEDGPAKAAVALDCLLNVVRTLAGRSGHEPRLWIVTRGGAPAQGLPQAYEPAPGQAALWGFGRVVMNEFPALACTLVDLGGAAALAENVDRLGRELLWPEGANEVVLAGEGRYCPVLDREEKGERKKAPEGARFGLDFFVPGQLRNLLWLPGEEAPLADGLIEVRTRATGLNFRDVMYLMGLLPDEAVESGFAGASLGLEFSGVVSRIGAGVTGLRPGDPVMGFGPSCLASHIVTRADAVARMPENWSFEAAATVPTVFFTVYYALKHLAGLEAGEKILIHGAAGGVGIAAIQLARHLGAEIFATAGSDEKRDFVRLLGADHVFDSRSLSFADDILAVTGGEGLDVVLNSLAGEAMRRSLGVLKPFGRFLELGKRDFFENTPVGLRPFRNNICYHGIDADQLLTAKPKLSARLFSEVMELFRQDILSPLPYRVFSAESVADAFRTMQQARHIGKIVISFENARPMLACPRKEQSRMAFDHGANWLVTGGLSGFGLESARWLVSRGVGNLALVGRRGMATPGAGELCEEFARQGVNVSVFACDIADAASAEALIREVGETMPPLTGVLHAAAVFDDRLISGLDADSIDAVLRPKFTGAWNLHQATLALPLAHFVLYSSVSAAIGNPGQANYVAANLGLESLAEKRRRMGLPATCIAWGPIGDTGYLAHNDAVKNSLEQRLGSKALSASEALALLDGLLAGNSGPRLLANFDWRGLARLLPSATGSRFTLLNRNLTEQGASRDEFDIHALMAEKTPGEIAEIIQEMIVQEVARTLCIEPGRIAPDRPLHDIGLDSLMAVELALGLERRFGVQFSIMALNDAPTVAKVAASIGEKLFGSADDDKEASMNAYVKDLAAQHGEDLSHEEFVGLAEEARALAAAETRLIE